MTRQALAIDEAAIGRDVRRSMRAKRWGAFQLALPLLITLLIAFVAPIALLFHKAIDNEEPGRVLSRTMAAMPEWVTGELPPEPLYAALAADLAQAHQEKSAALLGKRLNYELSGARSVIVSTARKAGALAPVGVKEQLIAHDPLWGSPELWQILRRNAAPLTAHFLLSAVDMRQSATDGLERVPEDQRVFLAILGRTLLIAAMVTVLTLLLGFPVAYVISIAPARVAAIMLLLVLLPLWTSLLVRTTAWVVLLQTEGVINDTLMALGLTAERLQLIFSRIGTVTAMTHIQLPFTILPIYSVMKSIPPTQMRAVSLVLAYLRAADPAGRDGRLHHHLHPVARILHHAGTGRRAERSDDVELHLALHQSRTELGPRGRFGRGAFDGDDWHLSGVPASGGRREPEVRLDMWLPTYATPLERVARVALVAFAAAILAFLIAPLFVVAPLSFSRDPFFTFPVPAWSTRWYVDFFHNDRWTLSLINSVITAVLVTILATILGTMAALGLSSPHFPWRKPLMALMISPMIVPVVIIAVGSYLFFGWLDLTNTRIGLVLAHTALAAPFVVLTVFATLSTYDTNLTRAAQSLGASPLAAFFKVTLPMILPGILSGAIFAFATSFDEVVVALFLTGAEQRTLPVQMFSGIRDQINPTILSVTLFALITWLSKRKQG
jgi:putative spermidine/putrescine transport system permease protein